MSTDTTPVAGGEDIQNEEIEQSTQEMIDVSLNTEGDQPAGRSPAANETPADEPTIIPPRPSTIAEEYQLIKPMLKGPVEAGKTYYLLDALWWKRFEYQSSSTLGPIDNESILEPEIPGVLRMLKKGSSEQFDYVIVSKPVWDILMVWYGGGPAVPRLAREGSYYSRVVVDTRPFTLEVAKSSEIKEKSTVYVSKYTKVGEFKKMMCEKFGLDPLKVRVWDYYQGSPFSMLDDMDQTLEGARIQDNQMMLIEQQDDEGKWTVKKQSSSYSSYSSYSAYNQPTDPGLTGLINLGNTCFMASSLQCLSNTTPLRKFFLEGTYRNDINRDNPLGMGGEIAEAYAGLLQQLWAGTHTAVAPREFKSRLENFAPQFAGYQQHDSQELLAFLLDGLHEDLNRIKKKPSTQNPEVSEGRSEAEVAEEAWTMHKSRNDSAVVDLFQGQLKSTLVCPDCSRVSITFDPFMYLSLPLSHKTSRQIAVTVQFLDLAKPAMKYLLEVPLEGYVGDLIEKVSEISGVPADTILIADVYNSRFYKVFRNNEKLETIQDRDIIWAYETANEEMEDAEVVQVFNCPLNQVTGTFGIPFFLKVPNASQIRVGDLYEMAHREVSRYITPGNSAGISMADRNASTDSDDTDSDLDSTRMGDAALNNSDDNSDLDQQMHTPSETPTSNSPTLPKKSPRLFQMGDSYRHILGENDDDVIDLRKLRDRTVFLHWPYHNMYHEKTPELHESCATVKSDKKMTLEDCIELFTTAEQLGPDDPWYCNRCKDFKQATKKFDLWSLPPVLVVCLKRFSYRNKYWREKLETFVDYPVHHLDISKHINGPNKSGMYDLYAVSNHFGSMGGGHYTAYAKNENKNRWYGFNDSSVSEVSESEVKTASAYVLFYRRRDPAASAVPAAIPAAAENPKDEVSDSDESTQPMTTEVEVETNF
eukprot:TRINITY_DN254_c0_g1_i1.p1 TRINITY_DN254_c0_g1~~TRINITY_DN254_c0_g1_i1.p1  ORF type:complete len:927 (-),score=294.62 TRINITY_DN254_c0_g1_i1:361-3141(-)